MEMYEATEVMTATKLLPFYSFFEVQYKTHDSTCIQQERLVAQLLSPKRKEQLITMQY